MSRDAVFLDLCNRMGHDNEKDLEELFADEVSYPGELWTALGEDWDQELLDKGKEPPFVINMDHVYFYDLL